MTWDILIWQKKRPKPCPLPNQKAKILKSDQTYNENLGNLQGDRLQGKLGGRWFYICRRLGLTLPFHNF